MGTSSERNPEPNPDPGPDTGHVVVRSSGERESPLILRFLLSERLLHWSLAVPFVLLYMSAAMMALLWGEPHPRHFHDAFRWMHRACGVGLIVLPPLALLRGWREWRMHLQNMKEGWLWTRNDFRWLLLFPLAARDPRVELPEQGKFNAAEKLNFMMVSVTYPLYIVTGVLVWLPGVAFFSYLAHMAAAVMGLPLVAGHIFMATINPSTRIGLSGMFTGWVDREWAKHHYRSWYRDRFEGAAARPAKPAVALFQQPAQVSCGKCGTLVEFRSWAALLERSFRVEPLFCQRCHAPIELWAYDDSHAADGIVRHIESAGGDQPYRGEPGRAA